MRQHILSQNTRTTEAFVIVLRVDTVSNPSAPVWHFSDVTESGTENHRYEDIALYDDEQTANEVLQEFQASSSAFTLAFVQRVTFSTVETMTVEVK